MGVIVVYFRLSLKLVRYNEGMKIFSWNVNGLRAVLKKGALQDFLAKYNPDILCLQETKAKQGQAEVDLPDYIEIWNSAERAGYSGTAIFTRVEPIATREGFFSEQNDNPGWEDGYGDARTEGRVLTAEFEQFYLINTYVPNAKDGLERLKYREQIWDPALLDYIKTLEQTKPVIICGDFNVAHEEIDLARPKQNVGHAGFTDEERQGMTNYLNSGLIDTYRVFHPLERKYSWWSYRGGARQNNVGWRIDYFLASEILRERIKAADILDEVLGSDHCPVMIEYDEGLRAILNTSSEEAEPDYRAHLRMLGASAIEADKISESSETDELADISEEE